MHTSYSRANNLKHKPKSERAEIFAKRLKDKWGDQYTILGEYVDQRTPIQFRCQHCGHTFTRKPGNMIYADNTRDDWKPHNCDYVALLNKPEIDKLKWDNTFAAYRITSGWNHRKFVKHIRELFHGEYEVLTPFRGVAHKVVVFHKPCGSYTEKDAAALIDGHGCLRCSRAGLSQGVKCTESVLDQLHVSYKREYSLPGCKRINRLLFDFALFVDSELVGLIEYNGEQHYRSKQYTGGDERLRVIQERDRIKQDYCNERSIPLLVIRYNNRTNKAISSKIVPFLRSTGMLSAML